MFACALVARVGRDDRRSVEMRHAIGIDEKLELDLTGGTRSSAGLGWLRCRRRVLRWRLIDHSALDDRMFRVGSAASRCLRKPATTCVLLFLSLRTGFPSGALMVLRAGVASDFNISGDMTVR